MHFYLASQLDTAIYGNVSRITPDIPSWEFMTKTVQIAEKAKLDKLENKRNREETKESSDVLFLLKEKKPVPQKNNKAYFNCCDTDHLKKDCPRPNYGYCQNIMDAILIITILP